MKKSVWLPIALLTAGSAFYIYYGITWNAWQANLPNILIYIVIVIALFWALRKKEKIHNANEQYWKDNCSQQSNHATT